MSDTLTTLDPAADATVVDTTDATDPADATDEVLAEDQLVEEVSIDGMCGVY